MFIFVHHSNNQNGQRDLKPFSTDGETEAQSKKVSRECRCPCKCQGRKYPHVSCLHAQALSEALPA